MRKKSFKGSVNHSLAISRESRERQKKLGDRFSSIDFEFSDSINEFNYKDKSIPIGNLKMGDRAVNLTVSEMVRVITTLEDAIAAHRKKIKLGLY
tara:strand:- start:16 stop:300 length:285 start_codon:yes stop_codon:yes gene_type:complete